MEFAEGYLNSERCNPERKQKVIEWFQGAIKLLKKAATLSDRVLSQYMFPNDIREFKNCKIYKYLY